MNKIIKILLLTSVLLLLFSNMSNLFDVDLGWHLRFGKEATEGYFSFFDSYTWGHFNKPWVHHEWGGDLFFWLIYSNFGYQALMFVVSLAAATGFIISAARYKNKISIEVAIAALITAYTVSQLTAMRIATFTILFLAILLYTLSKAHERPLYWWWPLLFWLWSTFHGNWFLGLITASVYWGGAFLDFLSSKYLNTKPINPWTKKQLFNSFFALILSVLLVAINPYGFRLFKEIFDYFFINYYKTRIVEWKPSYYYSIYLFPLIIGPAIVMINSFLWKKRRIPTGELLISIMFSVAAIKYRRHWLFAALIIAPTFRIFLEPFFYFFSTKLKNAGQKIAIWTGVILTIILCLFLIYKTDFTPDVWSNRQLLASRNLPFEAVNFLKKELPDNKTVDIFNELGWGGYLNWTLPKTRVYIDGRGTGTWKINTSTLLLQAYEEILRTPGGLNKLEEQNVGYAILRAPLPEGSKITSWIDRQIYDFSFATSSDLTRELTRSERWKKIYSDNIAEVWKKL